MKSRTFDVRQFIGLIVNLAKFADGHGYYFLNTFKQLVIMPGHKGLKNSLFDLILDVLSLLPSYKVQCFSITRLANLTVNQLLVGEYATHGCLSSSIELLKVNLLKLAYRDPIICKPGQTSMYQDNGYYMFVC